MDSDNFNLKTLDVSSEIDVIIRKRLKALFKDRASESVESLYDANSLRVYKLFHNIPKMNNEADLFVFSTMKELYKKMNCCVSRYSSDFIYEDTVTMINLLVKYTNGINREWWYTAFSSLIQIRFKAVVDEERLFSNK